MTGWCPVHDRVFEAADALCPECGAALVAVEGEELRASAGYAEVVVGAEPEARREPGSLRETTRPETTTAKEPGPANPYALAAVVAGAVVVAFLAGYAFPRGRRPAPATTPQAKVEMTVGAARTGAGVTLRLESFSQSGSRVVLRIRVPQENQFDTGRVRGGDVQFLAGDREIAFGTLLARPTTSGFILEGAPDFPPGVAATALRINSIDVELGDEAVFPVDLSRVWPATAGNQPRSEAFRRSIKPRDGRTITMTGLVGWASGIEAAFEVAGGQSRWSYAVRSTLEFAGDVRSGEHLSMPDEFAAGSRPYLTLFERIPPGVRRANVRVQVDRLTISGTWIWDLTPHG